MFSRETFGPKVAEPNSSFRRKSIDLYLPKTNLSVTGRSLGEFLFPFFFFGTDKSKHMKKKQKLETILSGIDRVDILNSFRA